MFKKSSADEEHFFMETKMGVVTQKGEWFHTTAEQINEFAPGLLETISFSSLIKEAQAWVESASSLSLILLYTLLFFINAWIAAIIALAFHWFWYHYKSAFVVNKLYKLFIVINSTFVLFIIALLSLSILGMLQHYAALIIGLLFFILMKPGLLRKCWNRLSKPSKSRLSLNDRLLKMIIIKHALYEADSSPQELASMEERFVKFVTKLKNKDK